MAEIETISDFELIKMLADQHRLRILRLLMARPRTLTQLGELMGRHPAWVRHHLVRLEEAGLVSFMAAQAAGGFVEKYYQAKGRAFFIQELILPETHGEKPLVLMGSHDLALDMLARRVERRLGLNLIIHPVGSLDGLVALRQGIAQLSSSHLLDVPSGEYNLPTVRHLFPDRMVVLVTLAERLQGLMVKPGNPRQVRGLEDLGREDLVFVNRNRGSGTRLWLDNQLSRLGIPAAMVRGYNHEVPTHTAAAHAIHSGRADIGLGLEAAAHQANLGFIPLLRERFDLIMPEEAIRMASLQNMLEELTSLQFRRQVANLGGYETTHSGERLQP